VAALTRNRWPASSGTGGRLPPDYPADFTGIPNEDPAIIAGSFIFFPP